MDCHIYIYFVNSTLKTNKKHHHQEDVQYGVNLDVTSYTNGMRETHNLPGRALPYTVWDFYKVSDPPSTFVLNFCSPFYWRMHPPFFNLQTNELCPQTMEKSKSAHNCPPPSLLFSSEWLFHSHAEPSSFFLHCVECPLYPSRSVWQHGRSQYVST